MSTASASPSQSPPLVALAAWLLPGAGYLLLGQRTRGLVVGISILLLFVVGLLIAGVRVLDVPGYDATGQPIEINTATGPEWVMKAQPLSEIRDKPWSVPQVLTGPVSLLAGAASVWAARPSASHPDEPRGAESHVRINEIGSLYCSVAGLLNLLAIIDSASRSGVPA